MARTTRGPAMNATIRFIPWHSRHTSGARSWMTFARCARQSKQDAGTIPGNITFALDGVLHERGVLNMTYLALNLSRYVNGVAKKHGEISRLMFAGYSIEAITNGVHAATWVSEPFRDLFNRHIPG